LARHAVKRTRLMAISTSQTSGLPPEEQHFYYSFANGLIASMASFIVGGSFIASRSGEHYNTFVLAMPDGSTAFHDKDQPTMWENCYYLGGSHRSGFHF